MRSTTIERTIVQPTDLYDPGRYAQCVRVENTLYISGQVPLDVQGQLVGKGDVRAQAECVWHNIGLILKAAGGGFSNIVRVGTFLTNMGDRDACMQIRNEILGSHRVASTLLGVSALANPEFLIEIEAIAVLD